MRLMPHSVTMCLAMSVARSMSFPAPVGRCPKTSSSATLPPMSTEMVASRKSLL